MKQGIMVVALTLVASVAVGCEYGSTTPEQDEQREFDRTMEQVGAPESLKESSDAEAHEFESMY